MEPGKLPDEEEKVISTEVEMHDVDGNQDSDSDASNEQGDQYGFLASAVSTDAEKEASKIRERKLGSKARRRPAIPPKINKLDPAEVEQKDNTQDEVYNQVIASASNDALVVKSENDTQHDLEHPDDPEARSLQPETVDVSELNQKKTNDESHDLIQRKLAEEGANQDSISNNRNIETELVVPLDDHNDGLDESLLRVVNPDPKEEIAYRKKIMENDDREDTDYEGTRVSQTPTEDFFEESPKQQFDAELPNISTGSTDDPAAFLYANAPPESVTGSLQATPPPTEPRKRRKFVPMKAADVKVDDPERKIGRARARVISFKANGKIKYYEKAIVVNDTDDLLTYGVPQVIIKNFAQHVYVSHRVHTDGLNWYELTKRGAMRSWVLNSALRYVDPRKEHARREQEQEKNAKSAPSGDPTPAEFTDANNEAENLTRFKFFDVLSRMTMGQPVVWGTGKQRQKTVTKKVEQKKAQIVVEHDKAEIENKAHAEFDGHEKPSEAPPKLGEIMTPSSYRLVNNEEGKLEKEADQGDYSSSVGGIIYSASMKTDLLPDEAAKQRDLDTTNMLPATESVAEDRQSLPTSQRSRKLHQQSNDEVQYDNVARAVDEESPKQDIEEGSEMWDPGQPENEKDFSGKPEFGSLPAGTDRLKWLKGRWIEGFIKKYNAPDLSQLEWLNRVFFYEANRPGIMPDGGHNWSNQVYYIQANIKGMWDVGNFHNDSETNITELIRVGTTIIGIFPEVAEFSTISAPSFPESLQAMSREADLPEFVFTLHDMYAHAGNMENNMITTEAINGYAGDMFRKYYIHRKQGGWTVPYIDPKKIAYTRLEEDYDDGFNQLRGGAAEDPVGNDNNDPKEVDPEAGDKSAVPLDQGPTDDDDDITYHQKQSPDNDTDAISETGSHFSKERGESDASKKSSVEEPYIRAPPPLQRSFPKETKNLDPPGSARFFSQDSGVDIEQNAQGRAGPEEEVVKIELLPEDTAPAVEQVNLFENRRFAFDDIFGEYSPIYIRGNVTYVMVYSKNSEVHGSEGLGVLAIVTKTEDTAALATADNDLMRLRKRKKLNYQSDSTDSDTEEDSDSSSEDESLEASVSEKKVKLKMTRTKLSNRTRNTRSMSITDDKLRSGTQRQNELEESKTKESWSHKEELEPNMSSTVEIVAPPHSGGPADGVVVDDNQRLDENGLDETFDNSSPTVHHPAQKEQIRLPSVQARLHEDDEAAKQEGVCSAIWLMFAKHFISIIFIIIAFVLVILAQVLRWSLPKDSIAQQERAQRVEYMTQAFIVFCIVVAILVFFIHLHKDVRMISTKNSFKNEAIMGKNYIVARKNLEKMFEAKEISANKAVHHERNHRIVVVHVNNTEPSYHVSDTVDADLVIGNLTRISDINLRIKLEFDNRVPGLYTYNHRRTWRFIKISEVGEIASKNFDISEVIPLVNSETRSHMLLDKQAKIMKSEKDDKMSPEVRGFGAFFAVIWCLFCLGLLLGAEREIGFFMLVGLLLPALLNSWENPFSILIGLYCAMHYGASGGVGGKMYVTGYHKGVSPSMAIYVYAITICCIPVVMAVMKILAPSLIVFLSAKDISACAEFIGRECPNVFFAAYPLTAFIVSMCFISNLPVCASFLREYYVLALETVSPPPEVLKAFLSFFYAMEAVTLRLETCVFIVNVAQLDNRLLLSEIADLGKRFTGTEQQERNKRNGYGIPQQSGVRVGDALWGMIDDVTRKHQMISPANPTFKSDHLRLAGTSVAGAAYYAANFYRSSATGLYKSVATNTKGEVAQNSSRATISGDAGFCRALFWHLSYMFAIFLETLFYLPQFFLYLCGYGVYIAGGLALLPLTTILILANAFRWRLRLASDVDRYEANSNVFLRFISFWILLFLALQNAFFLWLKIIIIFLNLFVKTMASNTWLGKWRACEFLVTPKMTLFFLPALSATDSISPAELDGFKVAKRKRLFPHGDGGYESGTLNVFADMPVFPRVTRLGLVRVPIGRRNDHISAGKIRSTRDSCIGVAAGREMLMETGISR